MKAILFFHIQLEAAIESYRFVSQKKSNFSNNQFLKGRKEFDVSKLDSLGALESVLGQILMLLM